MKFLIADDKRLVYLNDDSITGDNIIEVEDDKLPEAFYPFYKLDENGNIIPDNEKILEKAKKVIETNIRNSFKETIEAGYYSKTFDITMDCDFFDAMKLKSGIDLMQQLGQSEVIVRDHFNKDHLLSIEDANKLVVEVGLYYLSQWKKKGQLLDKINQAQTLDDVLAISWEEGINDNGTS